MLQSAPSQLRERVVRAAEAVLERSGSVGPLELFQELRFLDPSHFEGWRKGNEHYRVLIEWILVGPEKFEKTLSHFGQWIRERGLSPVEASYTLSGRRGGAATLQVTADGDAKAEQFFRTHYAPANLPERKAEQLKKKLNKPPELVVFIKVSDEGSCSECGGEISKGQFLFLEKGQPLCLACADLDYLEFLPAGNMALSRRAKKHSQLWAVVVKFSRARNHYERQGLLVTAEALARAEEECAADADQRAVTRAKAAVARAAEDIELMAAMGHAIQERYPACPPVEAARIAEHTALRGSGRVGRSAAGRALQSDALDLAVIAHIRHEHTNYDQLLMTGADRRDARNLVRAQIDEVLAKWRNAA